MKSSFTRKAVAVVAVSLLGSGFGVARQTKHYPPFVPNLQQIESWELMHRIPLYRCSTPRSPRT